MKLIPLREFPALGLKSTEVIKSVIERPAQGATVATMRAGVRVLDALEKSGSDQLILEDADHAALVSAVNNFTFGMVTRELLAIIDDILNAQEPPAKQEAAA